MKDTPITRYGYTPQDDAVTDGAVGVLPSRRRGRPSSRSGHGSMAKGWRVGLKDTAMTREGGTQADDARAHAG
jgi:hypothetical protein